MTLQEFKLVKNKQIPDFCYAYEKKSDSRKYSIFTIDGGKTFLASIEEPIMDKRWYSIFSESHNSVQECLDAFIVFNDPRCLLCVR